MKKIFELKDFDTFVKELYESRIQKKSDVASAVEKIKEKYGDNARDFIAKIVQPIERLNPRELNPDYDNILSGLVCLIMLELQLNKDK